MLEPALGRRQLVVALGPAVALGFQDLAGVTEVSLSRFFWVRGIERRHNGLHIIIHGDMDAMERGPSPMLLPLDQGASQIGHETAILLDASELFEKNAHPLAPFLLVFVSGSFGLEVSFFQPSVKALICRGVSWPQTA